MPKKSKEKVEDVQEEEQYQVEVILAARAELDENGRDRWYYLVKWAYYDSDSNTWEPQKNLKACKRLCDSFWKHIGVDDEDYPVGTVFKAKESWIKKEKRLFARENDPEQQKLRLKREREENERIRKYRESKGRSTKLSPRDSQIHAQVRTKRKIMSKKSVVGSDPESSGSEGELYPKRISTKRKRGETTPPPEQSGSSTDIHLPHKKAQKLEGGTKVATSVINDKRNTVESLFSSDSDEPGQAPSESSPNGPFSGPSFEAKKGSTINPQSQIASSKVQGSPILRMTSKSVPQVSQGTIMTQKNKPSLPQRRQTASVATPHGTSASTSTIPQPTTPTIPPTQSPKQNPPASASAKAGAPQLPKRSLLTGRAAGPGVSTSVNSLPQIPNSKNPIGIPTKSRIHQDALQLVKPNAPQQVQKPLPPGITPRTTSAIKTSFKKRLDLPAITSTSEFQRTLTLPATASAGEPVLSPNIMVESPPHLDNVMLGPVDDNDNSMMLDDFDARAGATPVVSQSLSARAAEAFLKDIMPSELAAPLEPAIQEPWDILPPGALMSRKSSLSTKATREWTWTGQIFTEANQSKALFIARFDNITEPQRYGMRFSVALAERNQITFPSFHDNKDLHAILRACKKPQQFAGLHPAGEEDQAPMTTLARYMARHGKFVLVPTSLDGHVVANMLIAPCTEPICRRVLDIPPSISRGRPPLVVALLPWVTSTKHLSHRWRHEPNNLLPSNISIDTQRIYGTRWDELLRRYPNLHRAFRILKPSNTFLGYLTDHSPRRYYIWHDKGGSLTCTGLEAGLLRIILRHCLAEQVSSARAARMVFIHVGALSRLHQFPEFVDICSTKPSIQFHTYGTHASIPPEQWGFREIYPLGGVVTFTPMVILNDYLDVMNRISQIYSHPLWVCYVLPSVLGFVAKHHSDDPLMQFDLRKTPIILLLTAISEGQVALLNSPVVNNSPTNGVETNSDWVTAHWIERPETPRDILEFCVNVFNQKYGHMDRPQAALAILDEISSDLSRIRQQPIIMDKHRRYTILKAETECRLINSRDGNEWTTAIDFDFRDDFFPKQ